MDIVEEKDLRRFAVIDMFDIIIWDSDNVLECWDIYLLYGKEYCRGVYDYLQDMYLDISDIVDITGCQIHDSDS